MNKISTYAIIGITLLLGVAGIGSAYFLSTRSNVTPVAPQRPRAANTVESCDLTTFTITVSEFSCNSSCETDAECQGTNPDYVCYEDSSNNKYCRLDENPSSTTCTSLSTSTPSPTPTPTTTSSPSPTSQSTNTPTPTISATQTPSPVSQTTQLPDTGANSNLMLIIVPAIILLVSSIFLI